MTMTLQQQTLALRTLAFNIRKTLSSSQLTGMDAAPLLARLDSRLQELAELNTVADRIEAKKAVVGDLRKMTLEDGLPIETYPKLYDRLDDAEVQLERLEKQALRVGEIEAELLKDAVLVEAASSAMQHGCLNADLAGKVVVSQAKATLQEDGTLKTVFRSPEGHVRVNGRGEALGIADVVAQMPGSSDYGLIFGSVNTDAPAASQVKQPGQAWTGRNPWKAESFNLGEQGRIYKADPDLARRLAAEEGRTIGYGNAQGASSTRSAAPVAVDGKLNLTALGPFCKKDPGLARQIAAEHGLNI